MTVCQYCAGAMDASGCAKSIAGQVNGRPVVYYCTREPGHDGPCIACGVGDREHDLTGAAPDDPIIENDNEEQPTD